MYRYKRNYLLLFTVLILITCFCGKEASAAEVRYNYDNVLLYTIDDAQQLHYNAVYRARIANDVIVVGCGMQTLSDLRMTLGTADLPDTQYTTDPGNRTLGKRVTANLGADRSGTITVITVTSVTARPVVGISWRSNKINPQYPGYAEVLERNGACAVYLPRIRTPEEAEAVLKQIDGVFVTGGEGWDPSFYGETQTVHGSTGRNKTRDTSDLYLIQKALEMDVPMLAICRGMQGMNIALGGGLIQDIPYYLGQKVLSGEISAKRVTKVLSGRLPGRGTVRDTGYVRIDEEGKKIGNTYNTATRSYDPDSGCQEGHLRVEVDRINHTESYHVLSLGSDDPTASDESQSKWLQQMPYQDQQDKVLSTHHQAIDPQRLGEGLTIVARSPDSIVEAVEYQDNMFALGLQWHPEKDAHINSWVSREARETNNVPIRMLVQYSVINRIKNEVLDKLEFIEQSF